ncbi:hypothetical protein AALO_G00113530 [Alosa alosa]|uniref:Uncharacterized protein n=1 Tax=Alosa alosa TaxID=278164 RepID=A0AAV6GTS7_9TELE|nr:hypothetical protein AALO_G00113530 [Alosa alosa]
MEAPVNSEKSQLVNEKNAKMYSLQLKSEFPDSKDSYPSMPVENGDVAGAIELRRPVRAHCPGHKASSTGSGTGCSLRRSSTSPQ